MENHNFLSGFEHREWMGMGVAGIIINSYYGSFPHSLLSTRKLFIDLHGLDRVIGEVSWEGTTPPMESHNEEVVLCSLSSFCVIFKLV